MDVKAKKKIKTIIIKNLNTSWSTEKIVLKNQTYRLEKKMQKKFDRPHEVYQNSLVAHKRPKKDQTLIQQSWIWLEQNIHNT